MSAFLHDTNTRQPHTAQCTAPSHASSLAAQRSPLYAQVPVHHQRLVPGGGDHRDVCELHGVTGALRVVSRSGASLCISVAGGGGGGGGRGGGRAGQAGRLQHVRCAADRQRLAPLTAAVNQGAWLTEGYCCWVWLPAAEYHHRLVAFPAALCTTPRRRWVARWASRPSACRSSLWRRTAKVSQGRGAELSTAASHGAQLSSGRVADAGRRYALCTAEAG